MLKNISGFPEFLPRQQKVFDNMINKIRAVFELYGFMSVETSAIEKVESLLSKGNDNEIYGVKRLTCDEAGSDDEKTKLALRFDLTVPLARYVSQNYGRLSFPYKRYHIGPVWRGERAQSGRYRQFHQCDVDIINPGTDVSFWYNIELIQLLSRVFEALQLKNVVIRVNHRAILQGFIHSLGVKDSASVNDVMRWIDKIDKIDRNEIAENIVRQFSLDNRSAELLQQFLMKNRQAHDWMLFLSTSIDKSEAQAHEALEVMKQVIDIVGAGGTTKSQYVAVVFDPLLARGLNYYTGIVYEAVISDRKDIGSIGGGGSYANLTKHFCDKDFCGLGVSVGITRIMSLFLEEQLNSSTIMVMNPGNNCTQEELLNCADMLRSKDFKVSSYFDENSADISLKKKMKYANSMNFPVVVILEEQKKYNVRDMRSGEQKLVSCDDLCDEVAALLLK